MIISNKPVQYFTDDRDGNHKMGVVLIKVHSYTRNLDTKSYEIFLTDYVDGIAIKSKTLIKSYAEIDGLRQMLLNSAKDYSAFSGSVLEDELLADATLLLVKQALHYHSQPQDWIKYVAPTIEEPTIEEPTIEEPPQP